jgi:elongation factor Ts
MSNKDLLDNIKKLREMTGVGFKDCKLALDDSKGDIDKSIEFLRKKGIAKASKKMSRTASEGLALAKENNGDIAIIEINSETDFVAKNKDFISFCKELLEIVFTTQGNLEKLNDSKMKNGSLVKDNLVSLIAKIGEKITIRRAFFFDNKTGSNFLYVHSAIEKNVGKIISVVKIDGLVTGKNDDIGTKISMHIAASNPLAIDKDSLKKEVIDKELEIIKAEIVNSGKPTEIVEKISKGKITKFINDNTLLNQVWIMDPKKKVSDILKENKTENEIKILNFIRYKVGEGV